MIESGKLRTRLDLEVPTRTTASGKTSISFAKQGNTLHGQLVRQTSKEFVYAREVNNQITHLWRMRYSSAIVPKAQLKMIDDGDRVLNIVGVQNVFDLDREMLVSCIENTTA